MFYLPPLPDAAVINGPGHVEDSEKLEAFLIALAELDKIVIDPLPVPEPGTNGHIGWHNAIVKDIKTVADSLGVPVTLPPLSVKAGEAGHVTHHNLIRQALLDASTNAWNDATGGTISTYTVDGKKMRRHIFTDSGAFGIVRAFRPFTVYLLGGGGGGGAASTFTGGTGGSGGFVRVDTALPVGTLPVIVGQGAASDGNTGYQGGDSTLDKYRAGGGAGGYQNPQTNGRYGGGKSGAPSPDGDGEGTNRPSDTSGGPQAALGLSGRSRGGAGGEANTSRVGENGTSGAIVIDYQIGTA